MATVVGIMDRDGWDQRTDNVVVADPRRRALVWVPRDLWVDGVRNRINAAFKRGGHAALQAAVGEAGLDVRHSVCVQRRAVERFLADRVVRVPVEAPLEYLYPLTPLTRVQDGAKTIRFDPPAEDLSGERIHQWLGARRRPNGAGSDLDRIDRQKTFLRTLLEDGADFAPLAADRALLSVSSDEALRELGEVRADWRFQTLGPLTPRRIDGMEVLVVDRGARGRLRLLLRRP